MRSFIVYLLLLLKLSLITIGSNAIKSSCGLDGSPVTAVYEGVAAIESYPWMGMLYYPLGKKRFTTTVVLVTRQMVIAAASEIDKLPKTDFRAKVRVVLGHKCGVGNEIKVRDYTYHPEYIKDTISALAVIQLETDHVKIEMRPICQPPSHLMQPQFFAMTLTDSCKNPKMRIHRMKYVNIDECRNFYRRSGLGANSLWPVHMACARAFSGGRCVWRSGSVLAVKQDGRWRLLGFSIYGPGCGDPARFLNYGMYHQWVQRSSSTVGQPAITRMGDNHLVLRRSLANIRRYGPCDPEEKIAELYSDRVAILPELGIYHAKYNVSLYATFEYSCVTFRARHFNQKNYNKDQTPPLDVNMGTEDITPPKLSLRRWCATSTGMCFGFQQIELEFYVDISFSQALEFSMHAYGREAKIISATSAMKYANTHNGTHPHAPPYLIVLEELKEHYSKGPYEWFPKKK